MADLYVKKFDMINPFVVGIEPRNAGRAECFEER